MKRTRHTPEQVINKLREADAMLTSGRSMAQVLQHLGVSEQTFHRWRNQYGGMKSEEAKRLKELEVENARLKRLVAEKELDVSILREANDCPGKPQACRGSGWFRPRLGEIARNHRNDSIPRPRSRLATKSVL